MRYALAFLWLLVAAPVHAGDEPDVRAVGRPAPRTELGIAAPTNQFQGFVRVSAEKRFFESMADDTAYYRDVFTGGDTFNSDPNDGDSYSARLFAPNGNLIATWNPIVFHSSFNGQQDCWVGFLGGALCGVRSVFITWFVQSQCFADGMYRMEFLYNSQVYFSGMFELLPEIPPDALPSNLGTYNQGIYDGTDPARDHYDKRCYVTDPDIRHDCDGRSGEQKIFIKKLGCYLSSSALVTTYHGVGLSPPQLNDVLNAVTGGYNQGDVNPAKVASEASARGVAISYQGTKPDSALSQNICRFGPQLVGVKCNSKNRPGHWVVGTGFDRVANTVKIVDPSGGQATTLAKYGNKFCGTRIFSGPEFVVTLASRIIATFHSPVQLLLTDPLGRRLGLDAATGEYFEEIPDAHYDDVGLIDDETDLPDADPPKLLYLPRPAAGVYMLTVVGTADGSYDADFLTADARGAESETHLTDVSISEGSVQSLTFDYDGAASAEIHLGGGFDGGGQRPRDVNKFLSFGNPSQSPTQVPAGSQTFPLLIFYGPETDPGTFSADLDGLDITSLFDPSPGAAEVVELPLSSGRNVLKVSIDGALPNRVATDTDRLVFVVP